MDEVAPALVVGGRTTGLTMACVLARHGVPVRIVDKSPGIDPHCRATTLHSRTLEIFQDLGIVGPVLNEGELIRGGRQYANGQLFMHARYTDLDSPYPLMASLGQNRIETVLEKHLNDFGIEVERSTELLDFTAGANDVSATLKHADGTEEQAQTPWLIGCDGAHSRVRHLSGLSFPGEEDPHQYVVADVVVDAPFARDEWHGFLTDRGTLYFFHLPTPRTMVIADIPQHHDSGTEAPSLDEIQALVSERGPAGVRVSDPRWLGYFRIHYRLARHYRRGRAFLAGDAVHVHSPIGGLGMNTGIQDAYNLGWKLALVLRGKAPEALLDTYEIERRQVAEDVLRTTKNATAKNELFSHLSPADRARLFFNIVLPEAERVAEGKHREQLDLDYRLSPICTEGPGFAFRSGPHAGAQALDAAPLLVDGESLTLFELLSGNAHSLLLFAGPERAQSTEDALTPLAVRIAEEYGSLVNLFLVLAGKEKAHEPPPGSTFVSDAEGSLHRRYGAEKGCLYLIRPDGYIGYRDRHASFDALRSYLQRVLRH